MKLRVRSSAIWIFLFLGITAHAESPTGSIKITGVSSIPLEIEAEAEFRARSEFFTCKKMDLRWGVSPKKFYRTESAETDLQGGFEVDLDLNKGGICKWELYPYAFVTIKEKSEENSDSEGEPAKLKLAIWLSNLPTENWDLFDLGGSKDLICSRSLETCRPKGSDQRIRSEGYGLSFESGERQTIELNLEFED